MIFWRQSNYTFLHNYPTASMLLYDSETSNNLVLLIFYVNPKYTSEKYLKKIAVKFLILENYPENN